MDGEELCIEIYHVDGNAPEFTADAGGDGGRPQFLRVEFEVAFVYSFDTTLRLFYGLQAYGLAILMFVMLLVEVFQEFYWIDKNGFI